MDLTKAARTIFLLIVGLGLAVNGYSQSFLTNGLVAYYPFNGNANDESGNGNNGLLIGAKPTTDRLGEANKAFLFDGTSSYILTSHLHRLQTVDVLRFCAWQPSTAARLITRSSNTYVFRLLGG